MSNKFHVDPETGVSGPCGATKGQCPYRGESGNENHYDTEEEAVFAGQAILKEKFGAFARSTKGPKPFTLPEIEEFVDSTGQIRWKGSKSYYHLLGMPSSAIANMICRNIDSAVSSGVLPGDLQYEVASDPSIPGYIFVSLEKEGAKSRDYYNYSRNPKTRTTSRELKPEYAEALSNLRAIANSYNCEPHIAERGKAERGLVIDTVVKSNDFLEHMQNFSKESSIAQNTLRTLRESGLTDEQIAQQPEYVQAKEYYLQSLRKLATIDAESRMEDEAIGLNKIPDWNSIDAKAAQYAEKFISSVELEEKDTGQLSLTSLWVKFNDSFR